MLFNSSWKMIGTTPASAFNESSVECKSSTRRQIEWTENVNFIDKKLSGDSDKQNQALIDELNQLNNKCTLQTEPEKQLDEEVAMKQEDDTTSSVNNKKDKKRQFDFSKYVL